jgi:hypothetical protein
VCGTVFSERKPGKNNILQIDPFQNSLKFSSPEAVLLIEALKRAPGFFVIMLLFSSSLSMGFRSELRCATVFQLTLICFENAFLVYLQNVVLVEKIT